MSVTSPRTRPPHVADERTQLLGWLDLQREIVRLKCAGLSHADAHRVVVPTSPLLTVAGLVSHLRWTEHLWFEVRFLGSPQDASRAGTSNDDDFRVHGIPLRQLLTEYASQGARSNEIASAASFDDVAMRADYANGRATLRWVLQHMLEETARHLGHLDIVRELLDGRKSYY